MPIEILGLFGVEWFTQVILPFILVFVLMYALLEKTKLLGEARQVHAILSLVIGLIIVGVPLARGVISNIIPVISVLAVVLFVLLLLLGFVSTGAKEGEGILSNKPLQWFLGLIIFATIVIALLVSTGWLPKLTENISKQAWASQLWQTIMIVIIIGIVVAIIVRGGKAPQPGQ